jgi:hypothetical protein
MPAEGNHSSANPNICAACTELINSLDEQDLREEVKPADVKEDRIVPHSASMYGSTFVW